MRPGAASIRQSWLGGGLCLQTPLDSRGTGRCYDLERNGECLCLKASAAQKAGKVMP